MLLHSQHRFRRHNSCRSLLPLNLQCLPAIVFGSKSVATVVEESYIAQTTTRVITVVNIALITFLQVSLRLFCADLHASGSLAAIRDGTRPHVPPKYSVPNLTHYTRLHVLTRARFAHADINPR